MNQHLRSEPIPFIDVASQRRRLGDSIDDAVKRVSTIASSSTARKSPSSRSSLRPIAAPSTSIGCASGTDAILMVMMAKNVGPGDAVLCPSFTFCATASPVALTGATPVYVDVDEDTFNIEPGIAEARHRDRAQGRPQARRGHSGRSVRPARRSRCHRRDRQGRRPVRARRRRAGFWRELQGPQARHLRARHRDQLLPGKAARLLRRRRRDLHR